MSVLGSDFNQFQTTIMLEEQVRSRTAELEAALRENERIDHSLRKSEAKFRGLVSQSLVGIAIMENGRLSYANPKFAEMFGYTLEETPRLSLLDIAAASDRENGHLAGYEVLKAMGRLIKRHCRGTDIFCRYGGEEFLIVLPSIPAELAVQRADSIRAALAERPIVFQSVKIAVTASFGVATFPEQGATQTELIAAADRALYAAKEAGRNRVQAFRESMATLAVDSR